MVTSYSVQLRQKKWALSVIALISFFSLTLFGLQTAYGTEPIDEVTSPTSSPSPSPTASPTGSPSPSPTDGAPSPTQTLTTPTPTSEATITTLSTEEITGEISRVADNSVTIETDDGQTLQLDLSDNIRITRDEQDADIAELQPGDQVRAVVDENNNQILTLEATSSDNWWMQPEIVIGTLIGLLLLIGLVYWLIRRANRPRIKTTATNLNNL